MPKKPQDKVSRIGFGVAECGVCSVAFCSASGGRVPAYIQSSFISNIKGYYGLASRRFNMLNEAARQPRATDTDHDSPLAIPYMYSEGTLAQLHQLPLATADSQTFLSEQ